MIDDSVQIGGVSLVPQRLSALVARLDPLSFESGVNVMSESAAPVAVSANDAGGAGG